MAKAGVTVDRVVDTAARIADQQGTPAVTMSAVAQELGISVPGLYKHVDGLPGMNRLLAVRSTRELAEVMARAVMGRSGKAALRSLCDAYRQYATAHPGRYSATIRAALAGDDEHKQVSDRALAPVLAMLDGYGLAPTEQIDAARFLRSTLHGFVVLEHAGGFGLPQDIAVSFQSAVEAIDRGLRSWQPEHALP